MKAWYIVPYTQDPIETIPTRYCEIDDFTSELNEFNARWHELEILGNRAIVVIDAPQAVLNFLDTEFKRLPKNRLNDSLADLPQAVKSALLNELVEAGYPLAEIRARFGSDLSSYTLGDVLRFAAKRRHVISFDYKSGQIVLGAQILNRLSIDDLDRMI